MKYALTTCLIFFISLTSAQESVIFKQEYLPGKTYTSEIKMIQNSKVQALGKPEIIAEMEKQGFSSPMITKSDMYVQTILKTDKEMDGVIPFEIKYDNFNSKYLINGEEINIANPLENAKIIGTITEGIKLKVESVEGMTLDETLKQTLIKMIENLTQSIQFPQQPIQIGEKFSMLTPLQLPMPGVGNLDFQIYTEYTLTKIQNGIAYFDFTQTVAFNSEEQKFQITSSGLGKGSLEFELAENFITSINTIMDMKINIKISEELQLTTEVNSDSNINYTIN